MLLWGFSFAEHESLRVHNNLLPVEDFLNYATDNQELFCLWLVSLSKRRNNLVFPQQSLMYYARQMKITSPIIVFLEIFENSRFYSSFSSTAVISSSCYYGDGLATFPGLTTVRIWERRMSLRYIIQCFHFDTTRAKLPGICGKDLAKTSGSFSEDHETKSNLYKGI